MTPNEVGDILQVFDGLKYPFYYYKDRYALLLLAEFADRGKTVSELKRSCYGRLLQKPLLKKICAENRVLSKELLLRHWENENIPYRITFDKWGAWKDWDKYWHQTSRQGYNLVLQLNLPHEHDVRYSQLIGEERYFEFSCHPVRTEKAHTLAWVRMDFEEGGKEALIEEVQSDLVREVRSELNWIRRYKRENGRLPSRLTINYKSASNMFRYAELLQPHKELWQEAALSAAIHFLINEMGIRRIFYHTAEGGRSMKNIRGTSPPVSMYSQLPSKFCFRETLDYPMFLKCPPLRRRVRRPADRPENHSWYLLEL